jgi:hypothetical protein
MWVSYRSTMEGRNTPSLSRINAYVFQTTSLSPTETAGVSGAVNFMGIIIVIVAQTVSSEDQA